MSARTSLSVVAAILFAGCFTRARSPASGANGANAGDRDASVASGNAASSVSAAASPVQRPMLDGPIFDPTRLTLAESPALAAVRQAVAAEDFARAASLLEQHIAGEPAASPERSRLFYQLGHVEALAEDSMAAATAFDHAAEVEGPLVEYARVAAAQALVRAGHLDAGIERAGKVPDGHPAALSARLLVAEALEAKGDHDASLEIWRAHLAKSRHPPRWIEVALRAAQAILTTQPRGARAEEAARFARRVWVEAPTSGSAARALELDKQAATRIPESRSFRPVVPHGKRGASLASGAPGVRAALPADIARALTPDEQLTRAGALIDAQKSDDADKALGAFFALVPTPLMTDAVLCRAHLLRGAAALKLKDRGRAADQYAQAITHCAGSADDLVEAYYKGGRASSGAGRCAEAIDRFAAVEQKFAEHRYADDARLHQAECMLELGDETRYQTMVLSLPNDYPKGDMAGEGLFQLALRHMARGKWDVALPVLERAKEFPASELAYGGADRVAYFLARAHAKLGDAERAKTELASIVRGHPLGYYMLLAYAGLAEIDAAFARSVVADGMAHEPVGSFAVRDQPALHDPAFERAVELFRQGETDLARRELSLVDDALEGQAEVAWVAAILYAKNGATPASSGLLRTKALDWNQHFPAGGWREAWELVYPRPFADAVGREAKRSGIPDALAYAIMREESSFDPEAVSVSRAHGLMQLMLPTAKLVARDAGVVDCDEDALHQPDTNIALGCRFLANLRAKFTKNEALAIPAYNAGPGAARKWAAAAVGTDFDLWVEQIPYEETRRYTKRVLTSMAAYRFLYESRGDADGILPLPKTVAPL